MAWLRQGNQLIPSVCVCVCAHTGGREVMVIVFKFGI